MRSFWPRKSAPQAARLNRSGYPGVISAFLPAARFTDIVRDAPPLVYTTSVTTTHDRFMFRSTGSAMAWDDSVANFFRLPVFTRILRFRLLSTADGFIHTVDNRFNVGIGVEGIPSGQLGISWYDGAFQVISTACSVGVDYTLIAVSNASGMTMYLNGRQIGFLSSGSIVYQAGRGARLGAADYFGLAGATFDLYFTSFSNQTLRDGVARQISANPWMLFLQDVPMRYVAVSSAASYTLTATQGALTLTGAAALLRVSRKMAAAVGSIALTGSPASLTVQRKMLATTGSLALTGQSAALLVQRKITAAPGSLALTGQSAALLVQRKITAAPGALTLTGTSAGLFVQRKLVATPGAITLTGSSAGLSVQRKLVAEPGTLTITGSNASLRRNYVLRAEPGTLTFTGFNAGSASGYRLNAQSGTLALTGQPAELRVARRLQADAGSLTINGAPAALVYTPLGSYVMPASPGAISITGGGADIKVHRVLRAQAGNLSITGTDAEMRVARRMKAEPGSISITGNPVTMSAPPAAAPTLNPADIAAIAAAVWAHPYAEKLLTTKKFLALN